MSFPLCARIEPSDRIGALLRSPVQSQDSFRRSPFNFGMIALAIEITTSLPRICIDAAQNSKPIAVNQLGRSPFRLGF
jgi:hypothetical protein